MEILHRTRSRRVELADLGPVAQVRAGRLGLRLPQLLVGLWLYGTSSAIFVRSRLGLDPWDVFHAGVQRHWHASFGGIVIATSFAVLLLWIPLRQWPGLGTVLNSVIIGLAANAGLAMIPVVDSLWVRWVMLLGGVVLNGLAGALYIGAQFGPGPRDGLMTGISRRTGLSLRLVRSAIELSVLVIGWLLGGAVGLGTVIYALLIGPCVQFFLPMVTVHIEGPVAAPDEHEADLAGLE